MAMQASKNFPFPRALGALALAMAVGVPTGRVFAATAPTTPIVVELFTSEGCSSCPPADAFLRYLDGRQLVPGVQLIVMEEHVDYWDDAHWHDPFSSHQFTLRQAEYTQHLHVSEPYTPEMVVDGKFEFVGNDTGRAAKALDEARALQVVPLRLSAVKVEDGKLSAHVDTEALPEKAEVWAAVALDHAESQVNGGENAGHHLEHAAIVRDLVKLGKANKGDAFSKDFSIRLHTASQAARLIIFAQEPGEGRILGAALEHFQP